MCVCVCVCERRFIYRPYPAEPRATLCALLCDVDNS